MTQSFETRRQLLRVWFPKCKAGEPTTNHGAPQAFNMSVAIHRKTAKFLEDFERPCECVLLGGP